MEGRREEREGGKEGGREEREGGRERGEGRRERGRERGGREGGWVELALSFFFLLSRELLEFAKDNDDVAQEIAERYSCMPWLLCDV